MPSDRERSPQGRTPLPATVMRVKMCCAKCEEKAKEEAEEVDGVMTVVTDQSMDKVTVYGPADPHALLKKMKRHLDKHATFWPTEPGKEGPPPIFLGTRGEDGGERRVMDGGGGHEEGDKNHDRDHGHEEKGRIERGTPPGSPRKPHHPEPRMEDPRDGRAHAREMPHLEREMKDAGIRERHDPPRDPGHGPPREVVFIPVDARPLDPRAMRPVVDPRMVGGEPRLYGPPSPRGMGPPEGMVPIRTMRDPRDYRVPVDPHILPEPRGAEYGPTSPRGGDYGPRSPRGWEFVGANSPRGADYGPRSPREGEFGPSNPLGAKYGPRSPRESEFGPSNPRGPDYGQRSPREGKFGPSNPRGADYGPRSPREGEFGPSHPRGADYGPRSPREGDYVSPQIPRGVDYDPRSPRGPRSPRPPGPVLDRELSFSDFRPTDPRAVERPRGDPRDYQPVDPPHFGPIDPRAAEAFEFRGGDPRDYAPRSPRGIPPPEPMMPLSPRDMKGGDHGSYGTSELRGLRASEPRILLDVTKELRGGDQRPRDPRDRDYDPRDYRPEPPRRPHVSQYSEFRKGEADLREYQPKDTYFSNYTPSQSYQPGPLSSQDLENQPITNPNYIKHIIT